MTLCHLVARVRLGAASLLDPEVAPHLWRALRRAFPDALSAILMATHLHLLTPACGGRAARRRLRAVISGVARRRLADGRILRWDRVPLPAEVPERLKLKRQVRYVALNPSRARPGADPLAWPWSTHRDLVGAVADPWVTGDRLAAALGRSAVGFADDHHAYVSADPSVSVVGTPPPRPALPRVQPGDPLERIALAAAAATREQPSAIRKRGPARRLFIHLARERGWHQASAIAAACGADPSSVHRALTQPAPPGLGAALLCLGDPRLLVTQVDHHP